MRAARAAVPEASDVSHVGNIEPPERPAERIRAGLNDAISIARGEMEPMRIYAFAEGEAAGPAVTLFADPVMAVLAAYLALSVEQRARFRADQEKDRRPTGPLWVRYEDLIDRC